MRRRCDAALRDNVLEFAQQSLEHFGALRGEHRVLAPQRLVDLVCGGLQAAPAFGPQHDLDQDPLGLAVYRAGRPWCVHRFASLLNQRR